MTELFFSLWPAPGGSTEIDFRSVEKITISVLRLGKYIGWQMWNAKDDTTMKKGA